jgi:uncharacterized protein (DUF58 family)
MSLRQNAFALLVAATLLAIVGDWASGPDAARFWRLPVALLLAGLAYEAIMVRRAGLALTLQTRARWLLGRRSDVVLELSQRQRRALLLELAPAVPAGVDADPAVRSVALAASAATRIELPGVGRRLGRFRWPAQRVRVAGPLGLAWWPQRLAADATIAVVPDLLGERGTARGAASGGARASARAGAGAEVLQLRAFRPGDPVRAIDWKASARRGQLVSRDYTEDQHLDIIVAVDAGRSSGVWCDDLDRLGHYVNVTARFAEYAVDHDDQVGLVVFGDRPLAALPPARGAAAVQRIREQLGAVAVQPTDSNPIHAAARIRTLVRRRCLVILLTDIDDGAAAGQLAGAARLLQPQHLLFVVGLGSAALDAFAREPGEDWLDPYRTLAAEEGRVHRRRSLEALAAGGVRAIVTAPAGLERAVFDAYARLRRQRSV